MKRSLEAITSDLKKLSPADAQTICGLAYDLRDLDMMSPNGLTDREMAMRRLLRDIVSKRANDVRFAGIKL
jgi:hypothetical protein